MPTYEYECRACNHRFERRQRIDEEPVKVCPECGGATRRVLYPVGVIFKGSGWYSTDNRSDSRRSGANGKGADGKSETAESKAAEPKAEKAEPKSEPTKPAESAKK